MDGALFVVATDPASEGVRVELKLLKSLQYVLRLCSVTAMDDDVEVGFLYERGTLSWSPPTKRYWLTATLC